MNTSGIRAGVTCDGRGVSWLAEGCYSRIEEGRGAGEEERRRVEEGLDTPDRKPVIQSIKQSGLTRPGHWVKPCLRDAG
ncbi:hypothetical protein E2C01_083666 [Portunus trituberculatus]|uniref:Uncharacterized protein n=1 Tax=Portunus trituberculatus TaxID=210409 RepID=A0A5B7J488_PORTR|nr:hypothetical protein [Portunus trituberculatus]